MRKPPCKKDGVPCTKRCPGCQDHCPEMKDFHAALANDAEKKRREKDADDAYYEGKQRLGAENSLVPGSIHTSRKMGKVETRYKHKGKGARRRQ